jgi:RNA polymerase sigma-70 factor (ECF subfamily)
MGIEPLDDPFIEHRSLLFTVAYEILGSAADAEDVLQESWLRWAEVDRSEVREPRAYLVRIVTRQSLNQLRTMARRREDYVGEWLPEPLLTSPDVADDVELAESLSIAMLTVLETLGPDERAVFVLREVFDVPYDEIADAVGKTPAAVRQIAHRAKGHVVARRPRIEVAASEHEEVVERLVAALNTGDLQGLMDVLAPDVVSVADGGGKVRGAALRPIIGADRLARWLIGGMSKVEGALVASPTWVNGQPGIRMELDGHLVSVVSLTVAGGRVTEVYSIANPDKLRRVDAEAVVAR